MTRFNSLFVCSLLFAAVSFSPNSFAVSPENSLYFVTDMARDIANSYEGGSGLGKREFTPLEVQKATILLAKWAKKRKEDDLYKKIGYLFPQEAYDVATEMCKKGEDDCVRMFFHIMWIDAFIITLEDIRAYVFAEGKSAVGAFLAEWERVKALNATSEGAADPMPASSGALRNILSKNENDSIMRNMSLNVLFYPVVMGSFNFMQYKEKILPNWDKKMFGKRDKKVDAAGQNARELDMVACLDALSREMDHTMQEKLLNSYASFYHLAQVANLLNEEEVMSLIGSEDAISCLNKPADYRSECMNNQFAGSLIIDFEYWLNGRKSTIGHRFDQVLKDKKDSIKMSRRAMLEEFWKKQSL